MNTTNTRLDLSKVKDIIFKDISILLNSLKLEYTQDRDNIFMKCPIHEGSDNPNGLSISLDKQIWKCWTRGCHEHYQSDIFGLIKGVLNTDSFSDVLRYVSKLYNLDGAKNVNTDKHIGIVNNSDCDFSTIVRSISKSKTKNKQHRNHSIATELAPGGIPSPYFISRGFREETLRFFGVQEQTDKQGAFRHRAIIPIWFNSNLIGYIARATKEWLQPKYIFSEGIKKSDYLYNYDNAITSAQKYKCIFLVEGQGDVWRLWECGVKNVVGLFGKEISGAQRKLLLETGVTTLIILTDNDQAGRESKIKIKRDMSRLFKLIFPKMYTKDLGNMFIQDIKDNILNDLKGYY
jgi:5S rRNA maturation endonuclease (ribonuclease M5)